MRIREPLVTGVQANMFTGRTILDRGQINFQRVPPPASTCNRLFNLGIELSGPGINGQRSFTTVILDLDFVTAALPVCTPSRRDAGPTKLPESTRFLAILIFSSANYPD